MKELSSHKFPEVYKTLGVNIPDLGCVMLDVKPGQLPTMEDVGLTKDDLYYAADKSRFWIDGYVASHTPHVTLLYGLMKPATEWKALIDQVLDGWTPPNVEVEDIGFFLSPYENEPYYCIVAHIKISEQLKEGNDRLKFLPHINTFPGYKAHITLAYVKKDAELRDKTMALFWEKLNGKRLTVEGLNYGGNKKHNG